MRTVPDTALLPRNPATGEPIEPMDQPGYYPGYSTMGQQKFWEPATRDLVKDRVDQPPPIRHFTPEQADFWRAVFDHLIPQHDRTPDRRIPIVEPIDERLYTGKGVGYRYADMPNDSEMYRLGEQAINGEAEALFGAKFMLLPHRQQDEVLQAIHDKKPAGAPEIWKQMSIHRFWLNMMQDVSGSYYSHPWAWDEIGFGGPAYPRAYTRLERGEPEPWEVAEQRYDWTAPDYAVSDITGVTDDLHTESKQNS